MSKRWAVDYYVSGRLQLHQRRYFYWRWLAMLDVWGMNNLSMIPWVTARLVDGRD